MKMSQRLGDAPGVATGAFNLGFLIINQTGDAAAATAVWENCLAVFAGWVTEPHWRSA